jgi:hypothetical protein
MSILEFIRAKEAFLDRGGGVPTPGGLSSILTCGVEPLLANGFNCVSNVSAAPSCSTGYTAVAFLLLAAAVPATSLSIDRKTYFELELTPPPISIKQFGLLARI